MVSEDSIIMCVGFVSVLMDSSRSTTFKHQIQTLVGFAGIQLHRISHRQSFVSP